MEWSGAADSKGPWIQWRREERSPGKTGEFYKNLCMVAASGVATTTAQQFVQIEPPGSLFFLGPDPAEGALLCSFSPWWFPRVSAAAPVGTTWPLCSASERSLPFLSGGGWSQRVVKQVLKALRESSWVRGVLISTKVWLPKPLFFVWFIFFTVSTHAIPSRRVKISEGLVRQWVLFPILFQMQVWT